MASLMKLQAASMIALGSSLTASRMAPARLFSSMFMWKKSAINPMPGLPTARQMSAA